MTSQSGATLGSVGSRVRDEAAFDRFVREHYPRLIRLAGLICRRTSDAEDAVQAGLERAWRKREALRDPARLRPWLDRIVVREALRGTNRKLLALDAIVNPTVREIAVEESHPDLAVDWTAMRIA